MIPGDIVAVYLYPNRDKLITGMYIRDDSGHHVFMEVGKPAAPWLVPGRMCYIEMRSVGSKYELEVLA